MSDKTAHLSMIQSVISRHSNSALQVKCFCIAVVSAAIILSEGVIILSCLAPVVLFCLLDVYYLSLERSYRNLYNDVRRREESQIDFQMEPERVPRSEAFASLSIWPFYAVMVGLLILLFLFNHMR